MKLITINTAGENDYGEEYGQAGARIETETYKGGVSFGGGEPEDMTLGRDLSDAYDIPTLVREAYLAGKRGEELVEEEVTEE